MDRCLYTLQIFANHDTVIIWEKVFGISLTATNGFFYEEKVIWCSYVYYKFHLLSIATFNASFHSDKIIIAGTGVDLCCCIGDNGLKMVLLACYS